MTDDVNESTDLMKKLTINKMQTSQLNTKTTKIGDQYWLELTRETHQTRNAENRKTKYCNERNQQNIATIYWKPDYRIFDPYAWDFHEV